MSLVERGRSSLAISSLERVAAALDTNLVDLLPAAISEKQAEPLPHVTRADATDEITILGRGRTYILLSGRAPDRILEPLFIIVQPTEAVEEPYGHEGEEFLYVLSGELIYVLGDRRERIGPGDSIHLSSEVPHTILNDSDSPAKGILVTTRRFF